MDRNEILEQLAELTARIKELPKLAEKSTIIINGRKTGANKADISKMMKLSRL